MAIQLTESAAARMREYLAKHPQAAGVRFGVRKTGCSGFGYTVDLTDAIAAEDRVFDLDG
ncbi:MAG TPA: iron-sulfur cluster assembly accessory protein, partial [Rhodanobacteraceae bacterium]|nr:iron-sulfur cluster assembly accessory protein [Rhodanobacteraceae bacterium]